MKAMTILSVAFPFAPVGPDAVGGAEQVLSHIDRALVRAGHHSVVIACDGSTTHGTLVSTGPVRERLDECHRMRAHERHSDAIQRVLRDFRVDLVHMHGLDFAAYLPPAGVPVLATLHLPLSWYPKEVFSLERAGTFLQCVSASQLEGCPPGGRIVGVVENGVPTDRLRPTGKSFGYAAALGRICPEKGFHLAVQAARKANIPLLIGGAVFGYETHVRYFRECLKPLLETAPNRSWTPTNEPENSPGSPGHPPMNQRAAFGHFCRYVGPLGFRHKRMLLAGAQCLLVPSLVAETSSLVAMESLACGTPVVAFKAGALVDIVEHGRTGFLVSNVDQMADAIHAAAHVSREECRRAATERFSADRMTAEYISLYRNIIRASEHS